VVPISASVPTVTLLIPQIAVFTRLYFCAQAITVSIAKTDVTFYHILRAPQLRLGQLTANYVPSPCRRSRSTRSSSRRSSTRRTASCATRSNAPSTWCGPPLLCRQSIIVKTRKSLLCMCALDLHHLEMVDKFEHPTADSTCLHVDNLFMAGRSSRGRAASSRARAARRGWRPLRTRRC